MSKITAKRIASSIPATAVPLAKETGLQILKELHTATAFEVWIEHTGAVVPAIATPDKFPAFS